MVLTDLRSVYLFIFNFNATHAHIHVIIIHRLHLIDYILLLEHLQLVCKRCHCTCLVCVLIAFAVLTSRCFKLFKTDSFDN